MLKGVIFDLDGVLTDTAEFHYLAWKRIAFEELKFDFTKQDNEAFKGVSRRECLKILEDISGTDLTEAKREEILRIKNEYYLEHLNKLEQSNLKDGALTLVKECGDNGLKTAIASSSKNTKVVLNKTGIIKLFDAIIDGNSIKKTKPAPECFLLAAQRLKLVPKECAVIEDAQAGIDGAKEGGFVAIGVGEKRLYGVDLQFEKTRDIRLRDIERLFE